MSVIGGPNVITDGLIFYLDAGNPKSYPGTGTNWIDLGANANCTLTSSPTFNGGNGGYFQFNGTNNYVTCGNRSAVNNMSIQMWVRVLSNGGRFKGFAAAKGSSGYDYTTGFNMDLGINGSSAFTYVNYEGAAYQVWGGHNFMVSTVAFGTWCNICLTVSATTVAFYLNTAFESSQNRMFSDPIGMNELVVGARLFELPNTSINADISLVQIYNRALSTSEILQNYNTTKTRFGL